jgi:hypothetical protein
MTRKRSRSTSESDPRGGVVTLGGLLGDEAAARELSRWPRRGGARGGRMLGRLLGRLASGRLGGVLMARMGSARPFCFLCEFHSFDVAEARATAAEELARRDGGPLGLVRTREIVIEVRNLANEQGRWERLLAPATPSGPYRWELGDGPAIRIAEGDRDRIRQVVWEVGSLGRAADWLRREGWLGEVRDDGVSIAREPLQGLEVQLSEAAR